MISRIRRCLARRLWPERPPHWSDVAAELPFHSGLGDSAWLLYGLCRAMKPTVCVEIGSARGKSACYIGMALKQNRAGHFIAIHPHTKTN